MKRFSLALALAAYVGAGSAGAALAQVLPSPALDAPHPPLAGPPPNQPPRQLPPESDAASDPAMSNARNPPPSLPGSKAVGCPGRSTNPPPTGASSEGRSTKPTCG